MTPKKDPKDYLPLGAPTKYCPAMASRICDLIATHDLGYDKLREIYSDLPHRANVNLWRRKYPEFRAMYAQAKAEQIEFITEEILEIADDGTNDWMEHYDQKNGCTSWQLNGEHIQRSRVRIDTRKWLAAKLVPRLYGDKIVQEITSNSTIDDINKRKEAIQKAEKEY